MRRILHVLQVLAAGIVGAVTGALGVTVYIFTSGKDVEQDWPVDVDEADWVNLRELDREDLLDIVADLYEGDHEAMEDYLASLEELEPEDGEGE